jgi:phenylacetate-CoA ligase
MNTTLAKYIFFTIQKIRKEPFTKYFNEMKHNEILSDEKLELIQEGRAIKLLRHAYNNTSFYHNLLDSNNIDINGIRSIKDFKLLPVLTKEAFRSNLKSMIVYNFNKRYTYAKTSGSTGIPLKFIKDRDATAVHNACYYRGLSWNGVEIGSMEAMLWGVPVDKINRYKIKAIDFLLNRFRENEYDLTDNTLYDFYNRLKKKKPIVLSGYSSMVFQFAKFLNDKQMDGRCLGLKIVKCTSETIQDDYYRVIEKTFGCPLICEYGSAETGIVAFTCEKGGIHLNTDVVLIEYDNTQEDVQEEWKEAIITPLCNYSLPIIRYKIGDFIIPTDARCDCGRALPLIKKIVGRSGSIVYGINGKKFHSIIFYYIFKGLQDRKGGVKQFKVIQEKVDQLSVKIAKDKDFRDESINYLRLKIKEKLGEKMKISFEFHDIIKREKAGKLVDFVQKVN